MYIPAYAARQMAPVPFPGSPQGALRWTSHPFIESCITRIRSLNTGHEKTILNESAERPARYIYSVPEGRGFGRWTWYDFLALSLMIRGVLSPGSEARVDC
jgi:hypothetical protein